MTKGRRTKTKYVISVLALGFDLSDRRQQQIVEDNRQRVFEKMAHGDCLSSKWLCMLNPQGQAGTAVFCCLMRSEKICKCSPSLRFLSRIR